MQKFWLLIFIILLFSSQSDLISFYYSFAVGANQSAINLILFYSEIGFDIWLLQATQFCFIFITKGRSLLKKIIQGQQKPKRTMKAKMLIPMSQHPTLLYWRLSDFIIVYRGVTVWKMPGDWRKSTSQIPLMVHLTLTWQLARRGVPKKIADFLYVQQCKWSNK